MIFIKKVALLLLIICVLGGCSVKKNSSILISFETNGIFAHDLYSKKNSKISDLFVFQGYAFTKNKDKIIVFGEDKSNKNFDFYIIDIKTASVYSLNAYRFVENMKFKDNDLLKNDELSACSNLVFREDINTLFFIRYYTNNLYYRVYKLNYITGEVFVTPLISGNPDNSTLAVSEDNKTILYTVRTTIEDKNNKVTGVEDKFEIMKYDFDTGIETKYLDGSSAQYSPNYEYLLYFTDTSRIVVDLKNNKKYSAECSYGYYYSYSFSSDSQNLITQAYTTNSFSLFPSNRLEVQKIDFIKNKKTTIFKDNNGYVRNFLLIEN